MGAFDDMYNHFEKNMGNIGASRGIFREPNPEDLEHLYKDDLEEAEKTKADQPTVEEILQAIRERKSEQRTQKSVELDKAGPGRPRTGIKPVEGRGDYPSADKTWAQAYVILRHLRPESQGDYMYSEEVSPKQWGSADHQLLVKIHADLSAGMTHQAVWNKYGGKGKYPGNSDTGESSVENSMGIQKGSALANLLSAAAGWALSADTASREVPPEMAAEWERAVNREDKRRLQEEMLRRLHGKKKRLVRKSDDDPFLEALAEMEMFYKDHAPVPPRYGLMWDAVKHRWTRPEKVGRTVWEVQGKKRLRGAGTGAHERTRSTRGHGGKGSGSAEAGRRFRSVADTGRAHPHEAKRVGQVAHKRRKPVGGK